MDDGDNDEPLDQYMDVDECRKDLVKWQAQKIKDLEQEIADLKREREENYW